MSWASRRRSVYTLGTIALFALVLGVPIFFAVYEAPTCFDGKKNQGEVGVDTGGPCLLLDISQVTPYSVLWTRSFEVVTGVYSVVSYVDNPNINAGADFVTYTFKLFDEDGILIAERKGSTVITPNAINPIFEGGILTGERIPTKAFFDIDKQPTWEIRNSLASLLSVKSQLLHDEDIKPKVTAEIVNNSADPVEDIDVVVVLFDGKDNAIASSKTVISFLEARGGEQVVFTWPGPLKKSVARIEILPRIPQK